METPAAAIATLSPELLIKVFSYFEHSSDLAQAARACRQWARVLRDEQLWRAAFVQQLAGGREQLLSRLDEDSIGARPLSAAAATCWRSLFMAKIRSRRLWSGGHQLASYRFKDLGADETGGIEAVRLALDSRSLYVGSQAGLLHGIFTPEATLRRSVQYYSRTFDEEARVSAVSFAESTGAMALGLDDSSLIIYERTPLGSLGRNYQRKFLAPVATTNRQTTETLPVQQITWVSPSRVLVLCRRGRFPSSLLVSCDIFGDASGTTVVSAQPDINCWAVSRATGEIYWSSGGLVCGGSQQWEVPCFDGSVAALVWLSPGWLLASSRPSSELAVIDCRQGRLRERIALGARITIVVPATGGSYVVAVTDDMKVHVLRQAPADAGNLDAEE